MPVMTTMTSSEQQFLKALGARIAALRKERGLSQQTLADELGIAQQSYAHYEVGRARMPIWMLPQIAQALGVGPEDLIAEKAAPGKRGPAPQIQQKIERLTRLPKAKQKIVLEMLDGVLNQASR
jgi:transcriptional regulator with XRE-family HTH domain